MEIKFILIIIFLKTIHGTKNIRQSINCQKQINANNKDTDIQIDDLSDIYSVEISISKNKTFNPIENVNSIQVIISTSNTCGIILLRIL
jgi:hypothetical protein